MAFVYIVRCNFNEPAKEQAWNAWYSGPKIAQMLAKPHFRSCQRFARISGNGRNYLAQCGASPNGRRTSQIGAATCSTVVMRHRKHSRCLHKVAFTSCRSTARALTIHAAKAQLPGPA